MENRSSRQREVADRQDRPRRHVQHEISVEPPPGECGDGFSLRSDGRASQPARQLLTPSIR